MKKRDIFFLLLAAVILGVAGYLGYSQLAPKRATANGVEVEKVGVIPSSMDADGVATLRDPAKVRDYYAPVDLSSGLNNTAPFGP
jgi:hypothetical protein